MKAVMCDIQGGLMAVIADSAVTPARRAPWFVPDGDGPWLGTPMLTAVITRLGKSIDTAFARRYYDGIGTALWCHRGDNVATDPLAGLRDASLMTGDAITPGTLDALDRAISHVSRYATLKTGDIIAVTAPAPQADLHAPADLSIDFNTAQLPPLHIKVR